MIKPDLDKKILYESVKSLIECDSPHIHLPQQKLFTLFSLAFNYLLFCSTKDPGVYILRIEDSFLAEKLARKAKDQTSRQFVQRLLLPRKIRYQQSSFLLDFFHIGTWANTSAVPADKLKGALICKNTSSRPMEDQTEDVEEEGDESLDLMKDLPKDFYRTPLVENCPRTLTIAFGEEYEQAEVMNFSFIEESKEYAKGVTVADDLDL